jgi:hypothetical protein
MEFTKQLHALTVSKQIRPACVLRRLPFNGMKPTFRHRRHELYMSQIEMICKGLHKIAPLFLASGKGFTPVTQARFVDGNRPILLVPSLFRSAFFVVKFDF